MRSLPLVGGYVNATTTFALHEAQGRAIIAWCEKNYKNEDIKDWDMAARTFNLAKTIDELGESVL